MKVADSARRQLESFLALAQPGSAVSLLLGYTYDAEWNKSPHIDIAVLPPEAVEAMSRELAEFDEHLIHEFDGFPFAMPISDEDGLLEGHVLTYSATGFSLVRASS